MVEFPAQVTKEAKAVQEDITRAFPQGPNVGRNVVLLPVNQTAVLLAARAFDFVDRLPAYEAALKELVGALVAYKPELKMRIAHGGQVDEEQLGHVLDDLFYYDPPTHRMRPRSGVPDRVVKAAGAIQFDLRTAVSRGAPYLPLGLKEEIEAISPLPKYGLLENTLTPSGMKPTSQARASAKELARRIQMNVRQGKIAAVPPPLVRVSHTPHYSIYLLPTGAPSSPGEYSLVPFGIPGGRTEVGILEALLQAGTWDFDKHSWRGALCFALPFPYRVETEKSSGPELTRGEEFAEIICANTLSFTFGDTDNSGRKPERLAVQFSPDRKRITSGVLQWGGESFPVRGVLVDQGTFVLSFLATRTTRARALAGTVGLLQLEWDGTSWQDRAEVMLVRKAFRSGAKWWKQFQSSQVSEADQWAADRWPVVRSSVDMTCPSGLLTFRLQKAAITLAKTASTDPLRTLRMLGPYGQRSEVQQLLSLNTACLALAQTAPFFPPNLPPTKGAPDLSDCSASPLLFVGRAAPASRKFPTAALRRALEREQTTLQPSAAGAKALDLQLPPGDGDKTSWAYQDRYYRWIYVLGTRRLYRVHRKADGSYSLAYGSEDNVRLPEQLVRAVLSREKARAEAAQTAQAVVRRKAAQLLKRALESFTAGLSTLPVRFLGSYCKGKEGTTVPCSSNTDSPRFLMPAVSKSGPSWYGDPASLRHVPAMRRSFAFARSGGQSRIPTLLLMLRSAAATPEDGTTRAYKKLAAEVTLAREQYTRKQVEDLRETGGDKAAQLLEDALFETVGRGERKPRAIPVLPTRVGRLVVSSPIRRLTVTIYAVLDDAAVGVMADRAKANGGSDRAYSAFLRRTPTYPEYGIFYQAELSIEQIQAALRRYQSWFDKEAHLPQEEEVDLGRWSFPADEFKRIAGSRQTMVFRKRRVPFGAIAVFDPVAQVGGKKQRGRALYARSHGAVQFYSFILRLGEGNELRGLNRFTESLGLPAFSPEGHIIPEYTSAQQFYEARRPDGTSLWQGDLRAWMQGGKRTPMDISLQKSFPPLPMQLNPGPTLRKFILDEAGVTPHPFRQITALPLAHVYLEQNEPRVPLCVVGTVQVDRQQLTKLGRALPRALPMGRKNDGILLYDMRIPRFGAKNIPNADAIRSEMQDPEAPDGLRAWSGGQSATRALSEFFTETGWNRTAGRIFGLVNTPWQTPNLLSLTNVFALMNWDSDDFDIDDYYNTLTGSIRGSFSRLSDEVRRQRVAYGAFGGQQARLSARFQSPDLKALRFATKVPVNVTSVFGFADHVCRAIGCETKRGGRKTHLVALMQPQMEGLSLPWLPEKVQADIVAGKRDQVILSAEEALGEDFDLTKPYFAYIAGQPFRVHVSEVEEGEVEEGEGEEGGFVLHFEPIPKKTLAPQEKLYGLMLQYGIELPRSGSPAEVKEALLELREILSTTSKSTYKYRVDVGLLPEQLAEADELGRYAVQLKEDTATPDEAATGFAEHYLEEMSKLNPRRRPRRARKGRKSGRRSRRNPLPEKALRNPLPEKALVQVQQYADAYSRRTKPEDWPARQEAAEKALAQLRMESDPRTWELTEHSVGTLFPTKRTQRRTWAPEVRLREALGPSGFNLVTRISRLDADTVPTSAAGRPLVVDSEGTPLTVRQIVREALRLSLPWEEAKTLALIMQQAEMSLDEALATLQEQNQAAKRRGRKAMQASSAICKAHRRRKLGGFAPPPELVQMPDWRHSTTILVAPPGSMAQNTRVMTWRRGAHLDCDLVGPQEQLTYLIGKAVQSTMYWLAEKPRRQRTSPVYVGRVGDPRLYAAWRPGEPLTLDTIARNLGGTPVLMLWEPSEARAKREVKRYESAQRMLGVAPSAVPAPVSPAGREVDIFGEESPAKGPSEPPEVFDLDFWHEGEEQLE